MKNGLVMFCTYVIEVTDILICELSLQRPLLLQYLI